MFKFPDEKKQGGGKKNMGQLMEVESFWGTVGL